MWVFRLLIRLFPADFVAGRGREMERLFVEMRRDWIEERGAVGFTFWVALVWDTLREAGFEWAASIREGRRSATTMTLGEQMSTLWGDVRFAARQLVRQPVYALTVVVLMSVGVAGNAAVFRVVNGLFIRPLPFEQ